MHVKSAAKRARPSPTQLKRSKQKIRRESAKAAVAELKKQDPQELIAAAETRLAKLKSARVAGNLFRTRETVAARKRDHDRLQADIAAKKEELAPGQGTGDANLGHEVKVEGANQNACRRIENRRSKRQKCASQIWLPKRQLKQLTAEAEKTRMAPLPFSNRNCEHAFRSPANNT